ncbi:AAC(3) family N-acetyltransferase [Microlunatus parietis]|uniref:Aminoglycoside N(3)-acetyltransferase n=1 Tax=Microlunatus parietis TaxID=682979 RepID=A0A7Y9I7B2_9ACTN|nr:AAC(3) family N-acetyltransferase [Microlunatus parietis]NYE71438.1 aminoglycoside 3-N-acetyltransferase [Microlunatus parietis]
MTDRVTGEDELVAGLERLGLGAESIVFLHASLRSFGRVDGGAQTVITAVRQVCGTVLMFGAVGERTGVPAPPGLVRPNNSFYQADSWAAFDAAVAAATPAGPGLPTDGWLGAVAAAFADQPDVISGDHPLYPFRAAGDHAEELIKGQRPDRMLGPVEVLDRLDGDVLLLGVGHHANTTIHLAEQRLGRSLFYRYAVVAPGVWAEVPNVSGESHNFDDLEPRLAPVTAETMIGNCRARRIPARAVLASATSVIMNDPAALLCPDPDCRCGGALRQRLAVLAGE